MKIAGNAHERITIPEPVTNGSDPSLYEIAVTLMSGPVCCSFPYGRFRLLVEISSCLPIDPQHADVVPNLVSDCCFHGCDFSCDGCCRDSDYWANCCSAYRLLSLKRDQTSTVTPRGQRDNQRGNLSLRGSAEWVRPPAEARRAGAPPRPQRGRDRSVNGLLPSSRTPLTGRNYTTGPLNWQGGLGYYLELFSAYEEFGLGWAQRRCSAPARSYLMRAYCATSSAVAGLPRNRDRASRLQRERTCRRRPRPPSLRCPCTVWHGGRSRGGRRRQLWP